MTIKDIHNVDQLSIFGMFMVDTLFPVKRTLIDLNFEHTDDEVEFDPMEAAAAQAAIISGTY